VFSYVLGDQVSRSPYYGRLHLQSIPSEVKKIWHSRDVELPELPRHKWSWQLQDDMELFEAKDLLAKIMIDAPLSDRQMLVVELLAIEELTFQEISQRLNVTQERVRQIYIHAMRKLRSHQAKVTGISPYGLGEVMTWSHWKWSKQCM
jgi:RNA polymerase sigma factor (sigma-70 family)